MKKLFIQTKLFLSAMALSLSTNAQIISAYAGTNTIGYGGDNGSAVNAFLNSPRGMAFDASGNAYIADYNNNRVRKVNTSGIITTFAGTGVAGSTGDNGPATSAQMSGPSAIAIDASGNVYIADCNNSRIRKVNTSGVITTFAGTGSTGFSGDGGPATAAQIRNPTGVAFDATGNLYIADYTNNRIRQVNTSGIINTYAGSASQGFAGDNGPATSAQLYYPNGVAVDPAGNLYIADYGNQRIRKVTTGGVISTIAGTGVYGFSGDGGAATSAELGLPTAIALDAAGNMYIADHDNKRIRKINTTGIITTYAGIGVNGLNGDGGPASLSYMYSPFGVYVDGTNNVFICEARVRKVTACNSPVVTASSSNTLVCIGQTETLTASGASTYTWNPGGPGTSISISPSVATNYTLTGTDVNGCTNTTYIAESVTTCVTGVNEFSNANLQISVYPNPFNNKIIVSASIEKTSVIIYNVIGTVIYNAPIENEKSEIDLTEQPNGIYFIKIGLVTKKVIKR